MKTITMPKDEYDQLVSDNEKLRSGGMVCANVILWRGDSELPENAKKSVLESGAEVLPVSAIVDLKLEHDRRVDELRRITKRKETDWEEKNNKDSIICFVYGLISASLVATALWLS